MNMSPEREMDLVRYAQMGDSVALELLVAASRRRICWYASRFKRCGLSEEDLIHEGVVAFITCLRKKFQPQRGMRLWTFAKYSVYDALIKACAKQLGLSDDARGSYRRVECIHARLWQEKHAEPTAEEVAIASGVGLKTVKELLTLWQGRNIPLEMEIVTTDGDDAQSVADRLKGVEGDLLQRVLDVERLETAFRSLSNIPGSSEDLKFCTLAILRGDAFAMDTILNTVDHKSPKWYEWPEIISLLTTPDLEPNPPWPSVLSAWFPFLTNMSHCWADIRDLFVPPPPLLTEAGMRQWYRRQKKNRTVAQQG